MKKLNEQKTLAVTGILTALFCCFIMIPGIPIFVVVAVITAKIGLSFLVTIGVCLSMSYYFTFNLDKLGKILGR